MNIGSLLFMTDYSIVLPFSKEIVDVMIWLFPLTLCIGVLTAHFENVSGASVLLKVIGAIILLLSFKGGLDRCIDAGGLTGQIFIKNNSAIFKEWKEETVKISNGKMFKTKKKDALYDLSYTALLVSYVSGKLMTWTLFVLSIINTIISVIVRSTFPIALALSLIPSFYKIQKGLFIYLAYCFLLPVCVGAIIGTLDIFITDEFDQFGILQQLGFSIAFILSLGLSGKYVYHMLTGNGVAQTASTAGSSFTNLLSTTIAYGAANMAMKYPVAGGKKLGAKALDEVSRRSGLSNYLRGRTGSKSGRASYISQALDRDKITYSQIASNGVGGASGLSSHSQKVLKMSAFSGKSETDSIRQFSKEKISQNSNNTKVPFSSSEYSEWKSARKGHSSEGRSERGVFHNSTYGAHRPSDRSSRLDRFGNSNLKQENYYSDPNRQEKGSGKSYQIPKKSNLYSSSRRDNV